MKVIKTITKVTHDTTAHWNLHPTFVPLDGEIIVYTDKSMIDDGQGNITLIPGIKIGDGNAYLVDLPFVGDPGSSDVDLTEVADIIDAHVQNTDIHVNATEKANWNNKISCSVDGETLILSNM